MRNGKLLIIGGHEEKCKEGEILTLFTELAGKGRIGILPTASEIPGQVSQDYQKVFRKLGVAEVDVLNIQNREMAEEEDMLHKLEHLSALFITGGDQSRLADTIGDTAFHSLLYKRWQEGMAIAGTSAGASIMGEKMIVYSEMKSNEEKRVIIEMGKGFGFKKELLVDQHFSQRGRFGRLIDAIAENKELVGIGIDENTAIVVENDKFEVVGEHQVFVIDGKEGKLLDFDRSENGGEELAITDFKLHALTKGFHFNLSTRQIMKGKSNWNED